MGAIKNCIKVFNWKRLHFGRRDPPKKRWIVPNFALTEWKYKAQFHKKKDTTKQIIVYAKPRAENAHIH